ncbi:6-mannosyltransferase MNN10 [Durusdinium trenchii]|uniref:6-mannosyltransferase MNN10 n=1 Tax=Durusdinium trenchii TaxID=1381693 RepID=A0ABP0HPN2_9DINO
MPQFRLPNQRVAIVSICAYGETEPVRIIGTENHQVYAELHGYDLYQVTEKSQIKANLASQMDINDGRHKPFFWKVNVVRTKPALDEKTAGTLRTALFVGADIFLRPFCWFKTM